MSKLDETHNFIRLYVHACGISETPPIFHGWACLSLLAAAIAGRVYVPRMNSQTRPNLYIMLIGRSGIGKGQAIEQALRLAATIDPLRKRLFRGMLTAQALLDWMSGRTTERNPRGQATVKMGEPVPHPWVAIPELLTSLRTGVQAQDFISKLVDLWSPSPVEIQERTRTWGGTTIPKDQCINFIGASTSDWLSKCVSIEDIKGGFFGRMLAIEATEDSEPVPLPTLPSDYEAVWEWLQAQLWKLCTLEGECMLTTDAQDAYASWYVQHMHNRPGDEALDAAHVRSPELVMKLAILFSVAERYDLKITETHITEARMWVQQARTAMPGIIAAVSATRGSEGLQRFKTYMQRMQLCKREQAFKHLSSYGITARQLDEIETTFARTGELVPSTRGKVRWYHWISSRRIIGPLPETESGDQSADQP